MAVDGVRCCRSRHTAMARQWRGLQSHRERFSRISASAVLRHAKGRLTRHRDRFVEVEELGVVGLVERIAS
jgi:hypothetical protein